jgi:tetratricopeptide (TPR) repeat protein
MVWRLATAIVFLVLTPLCSKAQGARAEDLLTALKTVESLYYEAKFTAASAILDAIDLKAEVSSHRIEDQKKLRLYQALVEIALNDLEAAKRRLLQLLALDPGVQLSSEEYPPKITTIFAEVRKAFDDGRCNAVCAECEAASMQGDFAEAIDLIKPVLSQCPCARQLSSALGSTLAERGRTAFLAGNYSGALDEFERALQADPANLLAAQSSVLAATQLETSLRNGLAEWRKLFESREYVRARGAYEWVLRLTPDGKSSAADQILLSYRDRFDRDRDLWAKACARVDPITADSLRHEVRAIDPAGELNLEVLQQMASCPTVGCPELPSGAVLQRVVTRVLPKVEASLRPASKVAVKIRIDAQGNVAVLDIDNREGNLLVSQSIRDAVQRWKFAPELAAFSRSRCVVTSFLIQFE